MFDDWLDFFLDSEELEDDDGRFHEYNVIIQTLNGETPPVVLSVWATDVEAAMNCGELLSGVYLA